ncbi:hypothetical protein [Thermostaphylospora chromogena]|uniref:Uncharacterized protein n=1 Tax=Thermostaphylospora chromogena TaxID=35622 RepID=A0A1H1CDC4_9ACTN|nr:hypothetical protein [Thermostaphylospora chromogena]SDQ62118.1 hypothetical protein SAMN04489764_1418 [Thermostaphylospora chromogena]
MINHVWMTRLDDELFRDLDLRPPVSPGGDVTTPLPDGVDAADAPDPEAPSTDVDPLDAGAC